MSDQTSDVTMTKSMQSSSYHSVLLSHNIYIQLKHFYSQSERAHLFVFQEGIQGN